MSCHLFSQVLSMWRLKSTWHEAKREKPSTKQRNLEVNVGEPRRRRRHCSLMRNGTTKSSYKQSTSSFRSLPRAKGDQLALLSVIRIDIAASSDRFVTNREICKGVVCDKDRECVCGDIFTNMAHCGCT